MTRISDSKVLVDKAFSNIDLWRKGAISIRNKFGIYRSFGRKMESTDDRPTNGIKDETLQLADFKVYEKNTNPKPESHDQGDLLKMCAKLLTTGKHVDT